MSRMRSALRSYALEFPEPAPGPAPICASRSEFLGRGRPDRVAGADAFHNARSPDLYMDRFSQWLRKGRGKEPELWAAAAGARPSRSGSLIGEMLASVNLMGDLVLEHDAAGAVRQAMAKRLSPGAYLATAAAPGRTVIVIRV